jgi:cell division inhibitor SulA
MDRSMFGVKLAGRPRNYSCGMSSDRDRLQSLVDALPDTEVQVAISFLAELGEQEIVDAETAAKLDLARMEPGDDVPLEEVRRRLGL